MNVELPCGGSINIPSDWYPPAGEVTLGNLKDSGQKLFKPTGNTHFRANSNPRFTYAAVNVSPASDGPGEEAVRNTTPEELADYTREKKSDLEAQYTKTGKSSFVSFEPIRRSTIAGHSALVWDFTTLSPESSGGGGRLRIRYIQLMVDMKLVEITLTFDEIATAMWKPVMMKMQDSIRVAPARTKASMGSRWGQSRLTSIRVVIDLPAHFRSARARTGSIDPILRACEPPPVGKSPFAMTVKATAATTKTTPPVPTAADERGNAAAKAMSKALLAEHKRWNMPFITWKNGKMVSVKP